MNNSNTNHLGCFSGYSLYLLIAFLSSAFVASNTRNSVWLYLNQQDTEHLNIFKASPGRVWEALNFDSWHGRTEGGKWVCMRERRATGVGLTRHNRPPSGAVPPTAKSLTFVKSQIWCLMLARENMTTGTFCSHCSQSRTRLSWSFSK